MIAHQSKDRPSDVNLNCTVNSFGPVKTVDLDVLLGE
jgi:hypothetical protein